MSNPSDSQLCLPALPGVHSVLGRTAKGAGGAARVTKASTGGSVQGGPAGHRYLAQAVSFAEGLVRHVLELLGHSTRAPAGGVVLDHGCHKLRHF